MKKIDLKKEKGFTLIELLSVLGIIVVVGTVVSAIIISSLRAANKANQLNIVRQNGNFAILQASRTIQYAKSFDGVSKTYDGNPENDNFSNDCTQSDGQRYSAIKVTLFDQSKVVFACNPPSVPVTFSQTTGGAATDLIDTGSVSIIDCYFACTQVFKTDSPVIGINLNLAQASGTTFAEKTATIPFTTTITMRNPNR